MQKDNKLLTILIVTKDRYELFSSCLDRLSKLKNNKLIKFLIVDNSIDEEMHFKKFDLVSTYRGRIDISMRGCFGFIEARNYSVSLVDTEYFTMLDDDDILSDNLISILNEALSIDKDADYIGSVLIKDKYLNSGSVTHKATQVTDKLNHLHRFSHYPSDCFDKIWLMNSGVIFKTSLWRDNKISYISTTSDDVYAITSAYLCSKHPVFVSEYFGYITERNSCGSIKDEFLKLKYDLNFMLQYKKLLSEYTDDQSRSIILKAMSNNINQMLAIDNHKPVYLTSLYDGETSEVS